MVGSEKILSLFFGIYAFMNSKVSHGVEEAMM